MVWGEISYLMSPNMAGRSFIYGSDGTLSFLFADIFTIACVLPMAVMSFFAGSMLLARLLYILLRGILEIKESPHGVALKDKPGILCLHKKYNISIFSKITE